MKTLWIGLALLVGGTVLFALEPSASSAGMELLSRSDAAAIVGADNPFDPINPVPARVCKAESAFGACAAAYGTGPCLEFGDPCEACSPGATRIRKCRDGAGNCTPGSGTGHISCGEWFAGTCNMAGDGCHGIASGTCGNLDHQCNI